MGEITIRAGAHSDIAEIVAVTNSAFTIEEFLEGDRATPELVRRLMGEHDFFVAEDGSGRVIASVYCKVDGNRCLLSMLAVLPSEQGRGIGARMVSAVEDHARGRGCGVMEMITLSLRPDLPEYYARFGYKQAREEAFTPVRKLRGGAKCHAVILAKPL